MLLILSKSSSEDRFGCVRHILDDMERSGVRGAISTVNILIGMFGGIEELERCLGLVRKWELKMNGYTYKCLLQAYLRCKDSDKALQVYRDMRGRGYVLDIFAYNMLLDSLAKDEKVHSIVFYIFMIHVMLRLCRNTMCNVTRIFSAIDFVCKEF